MGAQYRLPCHIVPAALVRELLRSELLAIPAAPAPAGILNVHKTPTSLKSHKEGRDRLSLQHPEPEFFNF
jgi:hypothetical protein